MPWQTSSNVSPNSWLNLNPSRVSRRVLIFRSSVISDILTLLGFHDDALPRTESCGTAVHCISFAYTAEIFYFIGPPLCQKDEAKQEQVPTTSMIRLWLYMISSITEQTTRYLFRLSGKTSSAHPSLSTSINGTMQSMSYLFSYIFFYCPHSSFGHRHRSSESG